MRPGGLALMGTPRGGTSVSLSLFRGIPGIMVLNETMPEEMDVMRAIGQFPVWKSPHHCLKDPQIGREWLAKVFIIRDGRDALASRNQYVERYKIDPSFEPFLGILGFADLWNKYAALSLRSSAGVFRMEDLVMDPHRIIGMLYSLIGWSVPDHIHKYAEEHVKDGGSSLDENTLSFGKIGRWRDVLCEEESRLISQQLLREFGYV